MITELQINGFKKFDSALFSMSPLTVLTGMNGAGKTSVIHSLLLIKEANRRKDNIVELNGPFQLDLGTFGDIQNWDAPGTIKFVLKEENNVYNLELNGDSSALYANTTASSKKAPKIFANNKKARFFQYLSAERYGPKSVLGSSAVPLPLLEVGCRGEFSAQVLYSLGSQVIDKHRRCPDEDDNDVGLLKFETEKWLSRIVRPIQIDAEIFSGTTITAMRFRTPGEEWVRPPNMGFGVTYTLPVILAGLTAEPKSLLIIENPEAHLHPSGQSQMGYFLAKMAASGVQVLLETHSDHVLNGIRRAIGEFKVLSSDKATIYFFDSKEIHPQKLSFTETGSIDSWPHGFFDQFQIDVTALTRLRRSR